MMAPLLVVLHFVLAAALVSGMGWLALIPWRRAKDAHWTDRTRLLWPARITNGLMLITAPVALAAAQLVLLPELSWHYLYTVLAGLAGATLGMWPTTHAIFPKMRFRSWLRELATLVMIRLFMIGILITAGLCMPYELNGSALLLAAGVLVLMLWSIYGGALQLLRAVGALGEPPARLAAIVTEVAARMQLPLPRMWLLRIFGANALALPVLNTLLVTEGALEALADDELSAICAHEFAHLNEPKSVVTTRIFTALSSLPAIFVKPAFHAWGAFGCIAIGVAIVLISRFSRNFRNRMEKRADSMATIHEGAEPGTYARALEKIYEANQVPAVMKKNMVHPSLYDRLLAAGVTPAYPRPAPPPRFTWQRGVTMALLGVSVFIGIQRFAHGDEEKRARRPRHPATQWPRP